MRWKIAPMYRENHTVQHEKKRRNMCRTMVAPWSRVCNAARNNRWWSNTGRRPVQNPQDKYLAFPWHKRQNKLLKYVDPIHQTCASVGNYCFFETKHCGVNKNAPVVRGVRGKEKSAMSGEHCKCQELQCVHVEWHCEEKAFLEQNRAKTAPQIDAIDFRTATKSNHTIKQLFLHLQSSSFAQRVLLKQIDLFNGSKHCSQSIHGPKQIHWSVIACDYEHPCGFNQHWKDIVQTWNQMTNQHVQRDKQQTLTQKSETIGTYMAQNPFLNKHCKQLTLVQKKNIATNTLT